MPTSTQRFRLVGEDDASRAFLQVAAASRLLKSNMDDVSSSVMGLGKLMGGASLIPVVAGATAAITNLTTSLGAASGAGGIFGISVAGQVSAMMKQRQAIGVTDKSLSALTKGTQAYNDKLKQLHAQQRAFNQDFGPAAKGFNDMSDSWHKFLGATSPVTNGVLGKSFELVAEVLPKLVPVSNAAGKAVGGLIGDLTKWTEGPSFAHLLHFLETSGPKDITAFGHSIGNVLGGLGGILSNFVGPGDNAAATLETLTEKFDKWGHSKGVSTSVNHFLNYVSDNGPEISATLSALAEASPKIATALGELGSANLSVTSKFLTLVAGLPQKQFNLIADGLFAMAAGSKALTAVTGLGAVAKGLGGIVAGRGLTGGGGAAGSILGGVQKVYVVNMGPGGMGGSGMPGVPGVPGGDKMGTLGKLGIAATGIPILGAVVAGSQAVLTKEYGKTVGAIFGQVQRSLFALPDPSTIEAQTHIWKPVFSKIGEGITNIHVPSMGGLFGMPHDGPKGSPSLKATGTAAEALSRNLGKASQALELVGHSAQRVFPNAAKQAQNLASKVTSIQGGHASQQLELVGHSAQRAGQVGGNAVDSLTGKINHIPARTVHIGADTSQAQANIQALINAIGHVHDKTVHINTMTNATVVEHVSRSVTGGGGGVHSGSGGAGTSASRGFNSAPSWWDATGAPLLSSLVGRGRMPLSQILSGVRSGRSAGRSRLQATIGTRNAFAGGFQSFASSAFGADFGSDPVTGAAVAPTIGSILSFQKGQASQAAMVKHDVRKLVAMGLSPALLKQLQAAGAAGIPTIQALASGSRADIAQYNSLNRQTSSDLRSAGMSASNRIWGSQIQREQKHNAAIERLLKQLVDMAKHHPDKLVAELRGDHIDLLLKNERRRKGALQSDKK